MSDYLVVLTDTDADLPLVQDLEAAIAAAPGWTWRLRGPCVWVATRGPAHLAVWPLEGGVVVGDLFAQSPLGSAFGPPHRQPGEPAERFCRRLIAEAFGRYVVGLIAPEGGAVFRDPSGALDALSWRRGQARFLASDAPAAFGKLLPPTLDLDWRRIAAWTANSTAFAGELALTGLEAVTPGELLYDAPDGPGRKALWSPGAIVRLAEGRVKPSAGRLRAIVEASVAAFARQSGPILAELSGGLDSAIVGQALLRAEGAPVAAWLNYHVRDPQGDERPYARLAAAHLGVELTEVLHPDTALTLEQLQGLSAGVRPGLNGLDVLHDEDLAARAGALGARALITGQGGDTVFFQMATPLIFADHLRRIGPAALVSPVAVNLARWLGGSVWSVWRSAILALLGRPPPPPVPPPAWLTQKARDLAASQSLHPWLDDLDGVGPAKRRQIAGLVHGQLFSAPSARGRQAALIHPLLSQPVVEYGLACPADVLTGGGRRDRAFARTAFCERLPAAIITRRSKGHLSAYYSRLVCASLPVLRPMLLEGRLAAQGLVDRDALDAAMSEEALIWWGRCGELMDLACLEAWVRAWEERLLAGRKPGPPPQNS
ncbi:asparagine synthase-related protein [Phenylobacterium aquaticum]|uniref:asparagine synthase-related protein n=1 Tax=Phenylobacterium aquaticum TaxID=1763816 RepID=UPI001F5DEF2C|nr:asparagine synthase-related protein [Phenylobacterium aquaticum]MCI3135390.1 asparagine synthase-related protein [Phenylobacterium aquaticum]